MVAQGNVEVQMAGGSTLFRLNGEDGNSGKFGAGAHLAFVVFAVLMALVEGAVLVVTASRPSLFDDPSTYAVVGVPGFLSVFSWFASRTTFAEDPVQVRVGRDGLELQYRGGVTKRMTWTTGDLNLMLVDIYTPWIKGKRGEWHHEYSMRVRAQTFAIPSSLFDYLEKSVHTRGIARSTRVSRDSDGERLEVTYS